MRLRLGLPRGGYRAGDGCRAAVLTLVNVRGHHCAAGVAGTEGHTRLLLRGIFFLFCNWRPAAGAPRRPLSDLRCPTGVRRLVCSTGVVRRASRGGRRATGVALPATRY